MKTTNRPQQDIINSCFVLTENAAFNAWKLKKDHPESTQNFSLRVEEGDSRLFLRLYSEHDGKKTFLNGCLLPLKTLPSIVSLFAYYQRGIEDKIDLVLADSTVKIFEKMTGLNWEDSLKKPEVPRRFFESARTRVTLEFLKNLTLPVQESESTEVKDTVEAPKPKRSPRKKKSPTEEVAKEVSHD